MTNEMEMGPSMTPEQIAEEIERRVAEDGCTDECESCKLEVCAREGRGALIASDGTITFLK
jgi:hypothetical protein